MGAAREGIPAGGGKALPETMRAFAIDRFGEGGSLRRLPTPKANEGELVIRVRAAGVNPFDHKVRAGLKFLSGLPFPFTLGNDASGEVAQVGPGSARFRLGQAVFGAFWLSGSFAEYVRVKSDAAVAEKPASLSHIEAAALPGPALAALAALDGVDLKNGETVLIVGATGGVGSYALQMALARGARVIATARSDAEQYLRGLGVAETVDYTKGDLVSQIQSRFPKGVDTLVDVVSDRATLPRIASVLTPRGRLASTIHAADEAAFAGRGMRAVNVDVLGSNRGLDVVRDLVAGGKLKVPIEKTYPLEQAADALAQIASGHARGKLVLTVD
jgi:NADPH2:quinone reductase